MKYTVVSFLRALALLLALAGARPAFAVDSGDILVVSVKGEVHVTMNGAARNVRAGSVLELPASVRTGRDGGIELRQGRTTVAIGPESLLEFPALEKRGAPIDRIQQPRGNAFYDIGKRAGRKLRVETPYLVGVVKGTQFNVAARDEATTISLFEGLLEVRASDDSAVVELKAGEIASRRRGEKTISVLKMDAGKTPTGGTRQHGPSSGGDAPVPGLPGSRNDDRSEAHPLVAIVDTGNGTGLSAGGSVDLRTPVAVVGVEATVDTSLNSGNGAGAGIAADSGAVDAAASVSVSTTDGSGVDAGATVAASVGTVVDAGASAEVTTDTRVDAGPVSASVDSSTSVDITSQGAAVDVSANTQVDAGPVATSVETNASVDVGTSGVAADLATSTGVDTGAVNTTVDTSTSVDLAPDNTAVAVDAGASLAVADTSIEAPVSASAGADLSTGSVDLGVSVAGADLGLGVDLGLADSEPSTDTGSSTTTPATDTGDTGSTDVGGLLDGLLRRPGRR